MRFGASPHSQKRNAGTIKSRRKVALPVASEIDARLRAHRQRRDPVHLFAIRHAAMILAPGRLLRIAKQIGSGDVVVMADLGAAKAAEIALSIVRASAVFAISLLMIDALHFEAGVEAIPRGCFVGMDDRALGDARLDECESLALGLEHGRDRTALALADDDNALALAGLVHSKATVAAVLFVVRRLDVSAEIAAVNLAFLAFTAEDAVEHFAAHGFAELVEQDEGALVGDAQVAGERQGGFALHFVAEYGDSAEVNFQRQLVRGEQRAARHAEILRAFGAAKARGASRAAAIVSVQASACRADRRS